MADRADVVIVGGGIIGCAIAYELAKRGGRSVMVLERDRVGGQALIAHAGLLGALPVPDLPDSLHELTEASLDIYPQMVEDLRLRTGMEPELRRTGALYLLTPAYAMAAVQSVVSSVQRRDPDSRWVEGAGLRELEPALGEQYRGALFAPTESHILSSRLVQGYARAAALGGVEIREATEVREWITDGDRVTRLITANGVVDAGAVILAAGAWSGTLGRRLGLTLHVGPLRGQLIRLRAWAAPVRHIIHYEDFYLVVKGDGTIAIGSTEERASFDPRPTADGVSRLIRSAIYVVPALVDATFVDAMAGLRPLPVDGLPLIGPAPGLSNVLVATGHARNGVLWSPITARIIADLLEAKTPPVAINAFDPGRFAQD